MNVLYNSPRILKQNQLSPMLVDCVGAKCFGMMKSLGTILVVCPCGNLSYDRKSLSSQERPTREKHGLPRRDTCGLTILILIVIAGEAGTLRIRRVKVGTKQNVQI